MRPAAVAGLFYPARAAELAGAVERYLAAARAARPGYRLLPAPKAIIAPHAGFIYSAPIAASAYIHVEKLRSQIRRVVLVGPGHRLAFRGIALPNTDFFETPLGKVALDPAGMAALSTLDGVTQLAEAHREEHCLEVHLPFLQQILEDFAIVPMLVGEADPALIAAALRMVWGGDETLVVISSDLSHYHSHERASVLDQQSAQLIESMNDGIARAGHSEGPCGRLPIAGLLAEAKRRELTPVRLDLRNSGDTAGSRDQVVGYGSWAFWPADGPQFTEAEGVRLVMLAKESIRSAFNGDRSAPTVIDLAPQVQGQPLQTWRASFVTLKKNGALRGCIGSLLACAPLAQDVWDNARSAAFEDPRFPPLSDHELDGLAISVSILSPPMPMIVRNEDDLCGKLRPGVDGLILRSRSHSATFLPAVWRDLPDQRAFIAALKRKAGMAENDWPADMQVSRYMAQEVGL